jgi:hypothetical protein
MIVAVNSIAVVLFEISGMQAPMDTKNIHS